VAANSVQVIVMPKAGNDMEEGTLLKWHKAEGDVVKKGDVLFEIETDKASLEVESEHEGKLVRIVAKEDETVAVMMPVAYLAESDEALESWIKQHGGSDVKSVDKPVEKESASAAVPSKTVQAIEAPTAPVQTSPQPTDGRIKASPAARRLAGQTGVDLSTVGAGSGPQGRILSTDVQTAQPSSASRPAAAKPVAPIVARTEGPTRVAMSPMRKAIARNLTNSVTTAPHFFMKLTVDAGKLLEVYARQKLLCKASLNDLLVLAIARTMMKFPAFRCQVHGDDLVQFAGANIGVAVAVEDGLRVPVLLDVDRMSVAQLAAAAKDAVSRAREGKSVNMGKGTFTISNLGMTQIEEFTAIINPPEAGILAVGKIVDAVKIVPGAIVPAKQMTMWLSSDHRVIDGMVASQFLGELKKVLETPEVLEMEGSIG
jgi:pyruvate dehydrogenase E2 component (dihydrolipoamide acetyltransferase)